MIDAAIRSLIVAFVVPFDIKKKALLIKYDHLMADVWIILSCKSALSNKAVWRVLDAVLRVPPLVLSKEGPAFCMSTWCG